MLRLVLPKGSLEEQTLRLFREADLEIRKEPRSYKSRIDDPRVSEVRILRPQEIPRLVEEGYFDLGITGYDCVREMGADVEFVADLPYSKVSERPIRMVVAVPEDSPWESPSDLPEGSKIATEFPNLTREYFEKMGKRVKVYYSYGATEAKVPDIVDAIVDLTETGETLRKNRLKIIGEILQSTTKLIANRSSFQDKEKRKAIEEIKTLLLGVIEARGRVLISMNVPEEKLEDVISVLPAMKKPTVSRLFEAPYYEVVTVVEKNRVNILIPQLKSKGAEDILEIPISKIVR
jgi:ATP phosphoribosyltransferase